MNKITVNKIKFSHDYQKLPLNCNGSSARLIGVVRVKLYELSNSFLVYDTEFRGETGFYDLGSSFKDGIILTFLPNIGKPFTTVRRYTPNKMMYYQNKLGEHFTINIRKDKGS